MGLRTIWNNFKVLIVMGTSLGLIHWGWYNFKSHPALHKNKQDYIPEPGMSRSYSSQIIFKVTHPSVL
uniref:Uncharacterized protein n=1 Tax=Hucho hucho TaxID=62062 RepID=A0A4W5RGY9_9TELE